MMSAVILLLGAALPAAARAQASLQVNAQRRQAATAVVLDHVTVVDVAHGTLIPDQRVVITENRIQALGRPAAVPLPAGARRIEARGQYLMPGLWDLHVHAATSLNIGPASIYHEAKAVYAQLIANGVTGMRDPGASPPLDSFRVWKREIAAGRRIGPRLIVSGPGIDESPHCGAGVPWHICMAGPADAPRVVDSLKAAGADMLKLYGLSAPGYFALAAASRRAGIPFGGHVAAFDGGLPTSPIDGLIAADSGATILDHHIYANVCGSSQGADTVMSLALCAAAAARLQRHNTWVASEFGGPEPTDSFSALWQRTQGYAGLLDFPKPGEPAWRPLTATERRQLPTFADFQAALGIQAALGGEPGGPAFRSRGCERALLAYAADLPIVVGTDWPLFQYLNAGVGVHRALLDAVLCGIPPLWALQMATLNPARALRATDSLGTVEVGKLADLVLLEGDPLADIWNVSKIAAVVANGRYFDRAALDRLLLEAAAEWRVIGVLEQQRKSQRTAEPVGPQP